MPAIQISHDNFICHSWIFQGCFESCDIIGRWLFLHGLKQQVATSRNLGKRTWITPVCHQVMNQQCHLKGQQVGRTRSVECSRTNPPVDGGAHGGNIKKVGRAQGTTWIRITQAQGLYSKKEDALLGFANPSPTTTSSIFPGRSILESRKAQKNSTKKTKRGLPLKKMVLVGNVLMHFI